MTQRFLIVVVSATILSLLVSAAAIAIIPHAEANRVRIHQKDFPEHGLTLIGPSDPTFDQELASTLKGQSSEVVNTLKPFSVFLANKRERPVVAYVVQWCFTRPDGHNEYYRSGVLDPRALMDAPYLSEELKRQSGRVEPNSASFHSLLSLDGSGPFRLPLSRDEAEAVKQGKLDRGSLLQRYRAQLEKYTEITISITRRSSTMERLLALT